MWKGQAMEGKFIAFEELTGVVRAHRYGFYRTGLEKRIFLFMRQWNLQILRLDL